jgi:hypothetical protein
MNRIPLALRTAVRLAAAACMILGGLLFADVPAVDAVSGTCSYKPGSACTTGGGASPNRQCGGDEGCTTCVDSPGDTCYHESGPHIQNYREAES